MAVAHTTLNIALAPVALTHGAPDRKGAAGDVNRSMLITNEGPGLAFIGGPGVGPQGYGVKLPAGSSLPLDLGSDDVPYAVSDNDLDGARLTILHAGL